MNLFLSGISKDLLLPVYFACLISRRQLPKEGPFAMVQHFWPKGSFLRFAWVNDSLTCLGCPLLPESNSFGKLNGPYRGLLLHYRPCKNGIPSGARQTLTLIS